MRVATLVGPLGSSTFICYEWLWNRNAIAQDGEATETQRPRRPIGPCVLASRCGVTSARNRTIFGGSFEKFGRATFAIVQSIALPFPQYALATQYTPSTAPPFQTQHCPIQSRKKETALGIKWPLKPRQRSIPLFCSPPQIGSFLKELHATSLVRFLSFSPFHNL